MGLHENSRCTVQEVSSNPLYAFSDYGQVKSERDIQKPVTFFVSEAIGD
jgi:hypothetical protein